MNPNINDFGRRSFVSHTVGLKERIQKAENEDKQMERISHAAILRTDKIIVFDRDHGRCFERSPNDSCGKAMTQGFLTNKYRFVNRKEAASIAFQAKQIDKIVPDQILISEEIWLPKGGGKYIYDEKLGYIEDKE